MPTTDATPRRFPRALLGWPGRLLAPLLVVFTGLLLGQQYVNPNKRVLSASVGLLVSGLAWRVGMIAGLGVLILALPFPRGTVFGNTNLALILVLLVIWLLRVTQRQSPAPKASPLDLPIVGLIIMYILSFYNVHEDFFLIRGLQNFELFVGAVLMFYLVFNNVRRSEDLERVHIFMLISAVSLFAVAIFELSFPGTTLVRGWIDFGTIAEEGFEVHNLRVGSTFHDYEIFSEYCAITILLGFYMLVRARSVSRKAIYGLFLVLNGFVLFATVTRGAIIALGVGTLYLLWMVRRRLRFVPLTIGAVSLVVSLLAMNFIVANFTHSGDMFARMGKTRVVKGWMPDDRAETWENAWGRALVHPLLGSGPSYAQLPGWKFWWPHNLYLYYANIIGFPGLFFFLWLLAKSFRFTRPIGDDLNHPDYATGFLIICRTQLVVFVVNEVKIDYLRNNTYLLPVWLMFGCWAAASTIAHARPATALAPVGLAPAAVRLRAAGQ